MIERKAKPTVKYTVVSVTCDLCGKKYTDILELGEFHHINFKGGYNSIFGDIGLDMGRVECDICQHCLYNLIKGNYRVAYGKTPTSLDRLSLNNLGACWYGSGRNDPPTECRMNPFDAINWIADCLDQFVKRFELNPEGDPAIGILFDTAPLILDEEQPLGFVLLRYKSGVKHLHYQENPSYVDDPEEMIREIVAQTLSDQEVNPDD